MFSTPDYAPVRTARLLTPALAGVVAGTAVQLQQGWLFDMASYLALGVCAAAGLLWLLARHWSRPRQQRFSALRRWLPASVVTPLAVFTLTTLVAFAGCGVRASMHDRDTLAPALEGRDLELVGMVSAMPQRHEDGQRFRFRVETARLQGQLVDLPDQIILSWYSGSWGRDSTLANEAAPEAAALQAGQRWRLTARLKAPHGGINPGGFDYELWLWEQGILATGYVRDGTAQAAPQLLAQTGGYPLDRARQSVRDGIYQHVADARAAGVIAALVTGEQGAIERADWDLFRATGVAHLMSISGLHVTMFAWLAAALVGWLWRRSALWSPRLCHWQPAPVAALVGGALLAFGYALFSGWGVPSQRTVIMLCTVSALRLLGLQWPWPRIWLLALALVVTLDPWALLQAGFWLSFVAVAVLFVADPGERDRAEAGWRGRLWGALREQWVVTLALTPMTVLLFGQFTTVGLLANALAIPLVTLVVTPLAMLGVAVPSLWSLATWALQALMFYLSWLSQWPLATLALPAADTWAALAAIGGGILLVMRLPIPLRMLGLPLMLPLLLWQPHRPAAGDFSLLAADIGQGNAVIVRTQSHTLLYDAGPPFGASDAGQRVLVPLLQRGGDGLDVLMLSHRDSDHTGGAASVLAAYRKTPLLSSLAPEHPLLTGRSAVRCAAGQHWQWDGVRFDVLHPAPDEDLSGQKPNAASCVLKITSAQGASALLAGDIEADQEMRLVLQAREAQASGRSPLQSDLLLVPHHGSKTSSTPAFLQAVQPRWALVQAGYRNRYGHPAAPVVARYKSLGLALQDSAHCGAMHWQSGHPEQLLCEREIQRRYWHHRVP